ncbi:hypothetical protein [Prochlorococcus sp. MIT 0603]|uniref:hypothetical protein n=1 Tax=unclassified Prochlorococcus TaxID=2627481 RepID=UPI0005337EF9|nr:leucyl aminopeptidase [Prochlorococcus sp. MIT 0603]KGG18040.1 leucyl aminopeptidase [Prochlorococcus sp. MIT 0602]
MYLLIVKDYLSHRYIGPYLTTKEASEDLQRIPLSCTNKAKWQIHRLEDPKKNYLSTNKSSTLNVNFLPKAS